MILGLLQCTFETNSILANIRFTSVITTIELFCNMGTIPFKDITYLEAILGRATTKMIISWLIDNVF